MELEQRQSYCFIFNLIDITCDLPIEVIPNHEIDKANDEQISKIKEILDSFCNYTRIDPHHYEVVWSPRTDGESVLEKLSSSDWKYWVLNFKGSGESIGDIQYAANLSKIGFEFGFTFWKSGFQWSPLINFNYFNDNERFNEQAKIVSVSNIKEISNIYNLILDTKDSYPEIIKVIQMYHPVKMIPKSSDFIVLGYFSMIEALLTHKPTSNDTGDSITRQLKTKIPLLIHRFDEPIDYSHYFGLAIEDKIWTKLYKYRSCIAHGIQPDFKKELLVLNKRENVVSFLENVTKKLLIRSLREPDLVMDLKRC